MFFHVEPDTEERLGIIKMTNKEFVRITKLMIDLTNHAISLQDAIKAVENMQE